MVKELYSDLSIVKPQEGPFEFIHQNLMQSNIRALAAKKTHKKTHKMSFWCISGSVVTLGNIVYVILFGWWISLTYVVICPVMFLTIIAAPYGWYCLFRAGSCIFEKHSSCL